MLIKVTQEHIDKGTPTCSNCPVALAIKEHIDCNIALVVGPTFISMRHITRQNCYWEGDTPEVAAAFICNFDGKQPVEPFEFELDIPCDLAA